MTPTLKSVAETGAGKAEGLDRAAREFDVERVRRDFPLLAQVQDGRPIAYLDNAATSQKPQAVLDALARFYSEDCSNIHRSVHRLGERATEHYEAVRAKVAQWIHAADEREIIFVRGTTEGINLVAQSFGGSRLHAGDEVLITGLEHHSNIVPWQMACERTGAKLQVAPINDRGEVELESFERLLSGRTRIAALAHVSNALGTVNPVKKMIAAAHRAGAAVLVDGAQAAPHFNLDVRALDADFYAFSGHKMYAPTGIGVLYGKAALLESMPPWQGGGDMIESVTFAKTTYNRLPYKFEAGTPNIADVIGLGAALDYLGGISMDRIAAYDHALLAYATECVQSVSGLRIIGTAAHKAGVLSVVLPGAHPHDVGQVLDSFGVAVRAGHHCAQPVMEHFGLAATTRASFAFYNTREEVDRLTMALARAGEIFG